MRAESLDYICIERDLFLMAVNKIEKLSSLVEKIGDSIRFDPETASRLLGEDIIIDISESLLCSHGDWG